MQAHKNTYEFIYHIIRTHIHTSTHTYVTCKTQVHQHLTQYHKAPINEPTVLVCGIRSP